MSLYTLILIRLEGLFPTLESSSPLPLNTAIASPVGRALACIACARHGLTETELLAALEVPRVSAAPLLRALQESLISAEGLLMFHHSALTAAVERRYLSAQARPVVHSQLVKYFSTVPVENPRRLNELPWHLLYSGQHNALKDLLTDVTTLQKLQASEFTRLELAQLWRSMGFDGAASLYEVRCMCVLVEMWVGWVGVCDHLCLCFLQSSLQRYAKDETVAHTTSSLANAIAAAADALHEWACYPGADRLYTWALLTAETGNALVAYADVDNFIVSAATPPSSSQSRFNNSRQHQRNHRGGGGAGAGASGRGKKDSMPGMCACMCIYGRVCVCVCVCVCACMRVCAEAL